MGTAKIRIYQEEASRPGIGGKWSGYALSADGRKLANIGAIGLDSPRACIETLQRQYKAIVGAFAPCVVGI